MYVTPVTSIHRKNTSDFCHTIIRQKVLCEQPQNNVYLDICLKYSGQNAGQNCKEGKMRAIFGTVTTK